MSDFFKAFEKFLFRDVSFLLGGSVVVACGMYVFRRLPGADPPTFKILIAGGVAYAVGYTLQEFFTLAYLVRTKAGYSPNWLGKLLYRLFDRRATQPVDPDEYERAKSWLYEQAPQRFRDDHERTESLKQVGTSLGPSFLVASAILFLNTPVADPSFEVAASRGLALLGFALWLLGWLKVTQQAQYLIARFRVAQASSGVCGPASPGTGTAGQRTSGRT